ncbi:MAG TPA: nitroreductase family deazaflavin-dependent oxidoreductase [Pseudonocardiaceae bacterium]|jgi:deazaflavin-dependent oxidoreductase (nitroreductase family)|nr:nitroreductase family deazaflavin-dependent oxidoreductase [Pseudonocardiaceae bacterium]
MNPLGVLARRLGTATWFSRVFKFAVPMDTALHRLTSGRFGLADVASVNGLLLTTTGRHSGEQRTVPLLFVQSPKGYVVAGSNWGGQTHPGWSANLLTDPTASVTVRGRHEQVTARLAVDAERDECWALLREHWPAYDTYAERADREIRVFVLEPVGAVS